MSERRYELFAGKVIYTRERVIKLKDGTIIRDALPTHAEVLIKYNIRVEDVESKGFMSDGRYNILEYIDKSAEPFVYKSAIITTTLKKDESGEALIPDTPFPIFGWDVVLDGKRFFAFEDLKHEGMEIMAKVDYLPRDQALVEAFPGWLGVNPTKHLKYAEAFKADEKFVGWRE